MCFPKSPPRQVNKSLEIKSQWTMDYKEAPAQLTKRRQAFRYFFQATCCMEWMEEKGLLWNWSYCWAWVKNQIGMLVRVLLGRLCCFVCSVVRLQWHCHQTGLGLVVWWSQKVSKVNSSESILALGFFLLFMKPVVVG